MTSTLSTLVHYFCRRIKVAAMTFSDEHFTSTVLTMTAMGEIMLVMIYRIMVDGHILDRQHNVHATSCLNGTNKMPSVWT